MSLTTNMSLDKPTPSVSTGPGWASSINGDLDLLDIHDHSTGRGVKVTQAGLNITGDLTLNSNKLLACTALQLATGTAAVLGVSTDGTDLFFKDGGSTSIKITANGRVGPCLAGDYGQTGFTAQLKYTNSTTLYEMFSDAGVTYANLKALSLTLSAGALTMAAASISAAGNLAAVDMVGTGKLKFGNQLLLTPGTHFKTVPTGGGTYTVGAGDFAIMCDATSGSFNINLPALSASDGRILIFKISSATNSVTLVRSGSDKIDGTAANINVVGTAGAHGVVRILADLTNGSWWLI